MRGVPDHARSLLEVGHQDEWVRLAAEKRAALTPPPDRPIRELLRRGQHLSAQPAMLTRAVSSADEHAPN